MTVVTSPAEFPADIGPTVITIGKFDGLHFGHRRLISELRLEATKRDLAPVVVTFDRHPMQLFAPEKAPTALVSIEQKTELIAKQNVAAIVVLEFTRELSNIPAYEFVRDLLVGQLGMKAIVIGRDFHFGHKGLGDVDFLIDHAHEFGYEVVVVDDEIGENGRRASSTWVRECLEGGDVESATEVLGRYHDIRGTVVHGAKRGRELGFPTANLEPETLEGFIPADGVYAGWLHLGEESYPAAISIGNNPTFDGVPQKQVEAHIIDVSGIDIYGERVHVSFVHRLRGMEKFDSLEALIERMQQDVDETRVLLRGD
ncbi:bifunctional riboflavin kinase/FAD synthetase [Gulosibacter molinativorax]|uniref:Riboflavin biosynthesis protein n=1 Tax=Gulosibacter molinativorax TaxID=256821 RepID=A0ABT7C3L3_9MICO|nr:bifunctional riboflavin kinase/FAD synthetase [Gulosibacter molinativorax]MDJ1369844.1 bifunctional riboflavin kinase/FAD synthetase [Gulosibacter molinativorax]QUY61809.1 Riboflavin biosynthesis protein [Gulosibacter molinativorax]